MSRGRGSSFIRVLQHVQPRGTKLKDAVLEERVSRYTYVIDLPRSIAGTSLTHPPPSRAKWKEKVWLFL
ncbi:hypothetical protein F2P79_003222 [Pimephales promelas]|nr:hypothetical protein F2P79_003222 [Pimephales promelas]